MGHTRDLRWNQKSAGLRLSTFNRLRRVDKIEKIVKLASGPNTPKYAQSAMHTNGSHPQAIT